MGLPLLRTLLGLSVRGPRPSPSSRGLILAPNHQSWLDPLLVQAAVYPARITFLMTDDFFDLPVANLYFRAAGARPIREKGPSVAGMRAALEVLAAGGVVCIFPEGGLTPDGTLQPGRRGVAHLARKSGADVVPIGIRGSFRVLSKVQRWPRLAQCSVRLGDALVFAETGDRAGEKRFTESLMGRIRALAYGTPSASIAAGPGSA